MIKLEKLIEGIIKSLDEDFDSWQYKKMLTGESLKYKNIRLTYDRNEVKLYNKYNTVIISNEMSLSILAQIDKSSNSKFMSDIDKLLSDL